MYLGYQNEKIKFYVEEIFDEPTVEQWAYTQNEYAYDNEKQEYVIKDAEWEEEQAEKERQRIAKLHLTRGDVFRGLLLAKGVTRAQLRAIIEAMPDETQEQAIAKEYALIDFDEALEFYRGVALIDTVGAQLGITSEQMTKFFETNDWHELIAVEPEEESEETNED